MEQLQPKMKNRPISVWLLAATLLAVPLAIATPLAAFDVTPKLLAVMAGACAVWLALAAEPFAFCLVPSSSSSDQGEFPSRTSAPTLFAVSLTILAAFGIASTIFSND